MMPIPLRFAWREMRGGLRGFAVFVLCIALGVTAIAGVNSFAASLSNGLSREGRIILGGDIAVSLVQREANADERAVLASQGRVSKVATLRALARTADGRSALVEVKAADAAYPLFGAARTDPSLPLAEVFAQRDGVFGTAVDPALLARLDLRPGARVTVGSATFALRAALTSEPDKFAGNLAFGPRLLMSGEGLRATGLVQPGSLVRWTYRISLTPGRALDEAVDAIERQAPNAGWDIRTRTNASPSLERNVERFTQFLTMIGLTALLVGGVGVANAVKSHLDRRRDVIATLKSLGASGQRVFAIYLTQVLLLALVGALPGLALGAALPFVLAGAIGSLVPIPLAPAFEPANLALAGIYGVLTAVAFALWPLGRAHDIPASALFRDEVTGERRRPRWGYVAATAAVFAALAAFAVILAYDRRIALIFVAAAAGVFIGLRLVAAALMAGARLPRPRSTAWRLALSNIHRPGALTPSVVLSLGLGLALLVTVVQIDGNLRGQFLASLPERAPSFFFVDIQTSESAAFDAFLHREAPGAVLERVPMLRGRIVAANRVEAENLRPDPQAAWALQSDRGITYTDTVPAGSRVVAGEWWPADYSGPPLLSMEKRIADGLGLAVGDTLTVNALGRNVTARIANLRQVDWQSLGINFVLVYSPNTFRGAPHTQIATLALPGPGSNDREIALLKAVADTFPTVTVVRVREAIETVAGMMTNLALGIRGASGVTLLAAMLVLGGALAAGHRHRVYDAVILRTLGATRAKLLTAYALEYALLGLATALFGVAAGTAAAAYVLIRIMNLPFQWQLLPSVAVAAVAVAATIALGLVGTFTALGQKPAPVLRNL